jgi:hypothetical protein
METGNFTSETIVGGFWWWRSLFQGFHKKKNHRNSGSQWDGGGWIQGETQSRMNSTKRLFLGGLSSLLLAAGFARAADRLDPMNQSLHSSTMGLVVCGGPPPPPAPPCVGGGVEQ